MTLERPNFNDPKDKRLFEDLFYLRKKQSLTEKEKEFVNYMYHAEEHASGLDG